MRPAHAITAWLFERLDMDIALLGDLVEERELRSAIWYWRQVLFAVWAGIWSAIREHKVLAFRAVATGFAMEYSLIFLWEHQDSLFHTHGMPLTSIAMWIGNLSVVVLTQTATGWVVARTYRARGIAMVFAFLACFSLWYFSRQLFWATTMLMSWDRIDPRVHPYVVYAFVYIFLAAVSVLFGAILGHPKKVRSAAHPRVA